MRRTLYVLAVLAALVLIGAGCASSGGTMSPSPDEPKVLEKVLEDPSPDEEEDFNEPFDACNVDGSSRVKAGSVSVSVSSYPCTVDRTFKELDDLDKRKGRTLGLVWWSKLFLKTRLITRGVFSTFAGILGMG